MCVLLHYVDVHSCMEVSGQALTGPSMPVKNSQLIDKSFPGEDIRDCLCSGGAHSLHWTCIFVHPRQISILCKMKGFVCAFTFAHKVLLNTIKNCPKRDLKKDIPKYPMLQQCFASDLIVRKSL